MAAASWMHHAGRWLLDARLLVACTAQHAQHAQRTLWVDWAAAALAAQPKAQQVPSVLKALHRTCRQGSP